MFNFSVKVFAPLGVSLVVIIYRLSVALVA